MRRSFLTEYQPRKKRLLFYLRRWLNLLLANSWIIGAVIILAFGATSASFALVSDYQTSVAGSRSVFVGYGFITHLIRSMQYLAFSWRMVISLALVSAFLWAPVVHAIQLRILRGEPSTRRNFPNSKLVTFAAVLGIAGFIVFLQLYTRLPIQRPTGYDTLAYIYWINLTAGQGLFWPLFNSPTPLSIYFFYFSSTLSGIPSDSLFKFLPAGLLLSYAASTYLLLRILLKEDDIRYSRIPSLFGLLLAGTSVASLLFSLDLYRNLLGLTIQNLFMTFFILAIRWYKPKWLMLSAICLAIELLTYWPMFLITLVQLLIFGGLSITIKNQRERIVFVSFLTALPAIIASYAFLLIQYSYPLSNTMVKNFLWAIFPPPGLLSKGDVGIFGPSSVIPKFPDDSQRLMTGMLSESMGNPLPSLLALVAVPSLARLQDERMRLLFAYVIAISGLILSPIGIKDAYGVRLPLIFPVTILAAIGVRNIMQLCLQPNSHLRVPKLLRRPRVGIAGLTVLLALVLVITLQIGIEFQNAHAGSGAAASDIGTRELFRIRESFGLSNSHLILVIRGHDNWANSLYIVSPGAYYTGTLAYLLTNQTEPTSMIQDFGTYVVSLQSLETSGALHNLTAYTIVLTEHTYGPSDVEKQFLREVDEGVFVVPTAVVRSPQEMFRSWATDVGLNDISGLSGNIPDLSSFRVGFPSTIVIGTATLMLAVLSAIGVLLVVRRRIRAVARP